MLYINNSSSAYSEQRVSLGGNVYTLVFKFNVRNSGWYLSILDSSGTTPYLQGLQIKPNQNLTGRYTDSGLVGDIWCLRVKAEDSPLSLDNLGKDKVYRLVWVTDKESSVYDAVFFGGT